MMKQADRATGADSRNLVPFTCIEGDVSRGWLIICDHASNALPEEYGTLGLPPEQLERHIGYDIGAAGVAGELARRLGVPAVMANFSRLLIDANRGEDDPTLIMRLSDGAVVPGNAHFDEEERARRIDQYYAPYHEAIDGLIEQGIAAGKPPALFSVHTFTENWRGYLRPWHATILWDRDPRLPGPLLEALRGAPEIVAGENVPYSGELKGDCLYRHGTMRGLAHALIEIRQDLVRTEQGQAEWAERLAGILDGIGGNTDINGDLNEVRHYGSNTDARLHGASQVVQH